MLTNQIMKKTRLTCKKAKKRKLKLSPMLLKKKEGMTDIQNGKNFFFTQS